MFFCVVAWSSVGFGFVVSPAPRLTLVTRSADVIRSDSLVPFVEAPKSSEAPQVTERDPWSIGVRVMPNALAHGVWALAVMHLAQALFDGKGRAVLHGWFGGVGTTVHALLGGVLGLLLAFRTNQAYGRYWRATEAFGELRDALVAATNKAAHLNAEDDRKLYRALVRHLIAIPVAVAQGLKGINDRSEFVTALSAKELDDLEECRKVLGVSSAQYLFSSLNVLIQSIKASDDGRGNRLTLWQSLDTHLVAAARAYGVVETVRVSSPPRSYALHVRRFLLVWVATLPIALLCAWPTHVPFHPITAALVATTSALALYATDELAQLVGQPFEPLLRPKYKIVRRLELALVRTKRKTTFLSKFISPFRIGGREKHTKQDTTFPVDSWSKYVITTLRHIIIVQSLLERRVRSRSWVIVPEDLVQPPLISPEDTIEKHISEHHNSNNGTDANLRAATNIDGIDDEEEDDGEEDDAPGVDPDVL